MFDAQIVNCLHISHATTCIGAFTWFVFLTALSFHKESDKLRKHVTEFTQSTCRGSVYICHCVYVYSHTHSAWPKKKSPPKKRSHTNILLDRLQL